MFLKEFDINGSLSVNEIVDRDYRTADIFRKYGINYNSDSKYPLATACREKGLDTDTIVGELESAVRTNRISNRLNLSDWDAVFLIDYIVNIHHSYLKITLFETQELLKEFSKAHIKEFSWLAELEKNFDLLVKRIAPSMQQEEEVIFPYIRQIAHAHKHKEPYAGLFIRTLRKPVEEMMFKGHNTVKSIIDNIRNLTDSYTIPEKTFSNHTVLFNRLKELDNDLMQHLYIEDAILFPLVMNIEKELLNI